MHKTDKRRCAIRKDGKKLKIPGVEVSAESYAELLDEKSVQEDGKLLTILFNCSSI